MGEYFKLLSMQGLNPSQEKVVRHYGKPLLVVAGAGSGKTKTLAHKVEFLVKEKGKDPKRLLVITFTNKASKEIKDRIKKVAGVEPEWSGTFHSFALRLLREQGKRLGIKRDFTLLDEQDRNKLLKALLHDKKVSLEKLKGYISERIEDLKEPYDQELEDLFVAYLESLKKNNLMDFPSLMFYAHELLKETKDFWKNYFEFVLVDEFQDTNTIQYEILKLVSDKNVCVVGDPNQCIYEWRYARPDNILRFKEDFDPDVIKLEYNYRCKPYIIYTANAVLSASRASWKELVPTLVPVREGEEKPYVRRFQKPEEEAVWIAQKVKELLEGYPPSEIAILVRTSYITEPIERALAKLKIPYKVVGTVRFFERSEIKDALSFLKALANPYDFASFSRAVQIATVGIGEKTLELIKERGKGNMLAGAQLVLKELPPTKAQALYLFLKGLSKLHKDPFNLEGYLEEIDFYSYLERTYKDAKEREENVKELIRYLRERQKEGYNLEEVLQDISTLTTEEEEGVVRLITIHASKGLEFGVVFLPRLEEGILPHEKALNDPVELEEELRLFYVALTRAKDMVFMTYTREENKPSRFLSYIPKQHLDLSAFAKKKYAPELTVKHSLKVGGRVRHEIFGIGTVIALEENKAVVSFPRGIKTIHVAFLEPV